MYDILSGAQAIVFLITILGCIPYGIWVLYSLHKEKWKRVALQIAIPVVVYACLAGASALCQPKIVADYYAGLYDTEVKLGPALFEYDSEQSYRGQGYSISVHELPATIRQRFESADERLLGGYPKLPSYRNHWMFEHWREAPFDEKFKEHLDFALTCYYSDRPPGLTSRFDSIRKALARKGTYYAFFYNYPSGYIADIDLFIVDLNEGRLYSINYNK